MRCLIIGIVIAWVTIPTGMALPISIDFYDFCCEWWDALKEVFAYLIVAGGAIAAVVYLIMGVLQICA